MTSQSIEQEQPPIAALPFAPASKALVDLLSQDDAVVDQVAALLRLDGDSVAEVLRLANSPAFGFERQIRHLAHAIVMLGTRRVKALIATVGLKQASHSRQSLQGCWRHSVASAFLASEIAPGWALPPDEAYTAGLLHTLSSSDPAIGEVVSLACRLSSALGFPACEDIAAVSDLEPLLLRVPESAEARSDPARMARLLEEKIAYINN
jgi:HD-like signal output (HDOD) protein